ncbi:MAG: hypothetical protein SGPRY_008337 [Prymnesium sp.]
MRAWRSAELEVCTPATGASSLGITFADALFQVNLRQVDKTSIGFKRGLRAGDIVRSINGIRPGDADHAQAILVRPSIFGEMHKLIVFRPGWQDMLQMPTFVLCLIATACVIFAYFPFDRLQEERLDRDEL